MTALEKELSRLPQDAFLKVGARSSFFYAGSVADFAANIGDYTEAAFKLAKQSAKKQKDKLADILKNDTSPSAYASSVVVGKETVTKDGITVDGYLAWVKSYFRSVNRQIKTTENAQDALERFRPLRDRDVISVEKSIVDDNCYNIVLSGNEPGGFWMLNEAMDSKLSFETDDEDGGTT